MVKNMINKLLRKISLLLMILFGFALNFSLAAQAVIDNDTIRDIKKVSDSINLAKGEYYGSVKNKQVVLEDEYGEANFFLEQAQKKLNARAAGLSLENREGFKSVNEKIEQIAKTIKDKEDPEIMGKMVTEADQLLENLAGVSLNEFPAEAPSFDNGKKIFELNCAVCHGIKGFGNGPAAAALNPKPVNFHDLEFVREKSPYNFYRAIKNGIPGTAMPSWDFQLSRQEKWDVIKYVRAFSQNEQSAKKGKEIFNNFMSENNNLLQQKLSDISYTADRPDPELVKLLKLNKKFAAINDNDLFYLVNYIRNEKTEYPAIKTENLSKKDYLKQTINEIKKILYISREKYLANNPRDAVENSIASYMAFEPIERELGAKDKALARKLELSFNSLKGFYASEGNEAKVNSIIRDIEDGLEEVVATLNTDKYGFALLLQSMFLIMREGFEAIIILMALITFIKKTGPESSGLVKGMYYGIGLGILASIITAFILESVLRYSNFSKEFLEGITVLLAAAILFYVSHWLVSKTQAQQWQNFIKSTLNSALSSRNQLAIVSVGFLSVYREGFETILFYKALYTTSGDANMVSIGLILGSLGLLVLSVLIYRFSVKIPIKEFFLVTGLLLYYMVFSFVGKGLHELQEGNILSITGINHIPEIDLIGLYPTLETTTAQLIVLLAWLAAIAYSFYTRPKTEKVIEKQHVG